MIKKQNGVTLIELMISMVLGLGLVAGMGQLFVQSQKSFTLQRNISDMTDDGAFILETLAKGLLLAGYSEDGNVSDLPLIASVASLISTNVPDISLGAGEFIHGKDTTTNSQLVYRYKLSNQGELDNFVCTSSGISYDTGTTNKVITVRIYKDNDSNGIPVFYCKPKKDGTTAVAAQPLISEVEKLTFRYGIHNATNNTFYYAKAADVTDWTSVFAIKVYVVLRSVDDHLTRTNATYTVDGVTYTATDNRLYKVFSKTIFLRANDH